MATEKEIAERQLKALTAERRNLNKVISEGQAALEEQLQLKKQFAEYTVKIRDLEKEIAELAGTASAMHDSQLEAAYELLRQKTAEIKLYKEKLSLQEKSNELAESFSIRLGVSKSAVWETVKGFAESYSKLSDANKEAGKWLFRLRAISSVVGNIAKSFIMALNPISVLSSAMSAIWKASIELFVKFSSQMAQFSATAGDAGRVARQLGASMNLGLGINIEQVSRAAQGLVGNMSEFFSLSKRERAPVIEMAAGLERLNIPASEFGKNIDFMTKAMGLKLPKASHLMKELTQSAEAFGKTPQQMISDWTSLSNTLIEHGPRMTEVFLRLQAVSKASGLELNSMMTIANKFDTFDSAASSVGNLNAIMGGDYLNSLEMMNMSQDERVEAVKAAIEMTGRDFMQMEKYEKRAYAKELGVSTGELAKLMGYESDASKKARIEAEKKAAAQGRLDTMIGRTVDIMERLRLALQSIFAKTGLMKAFGKVFDQFMKMIGDKGFGKEIREMTDWLGDLMVMGIELGLSFMKYLVDNKEKIMGFFYEIKEGAERWWKSAEKHWLAHKPAIMAYWEDIKTKIKEFKVWMVDTFKYMMELEPEAMMTGLIAGLRRGWDVLVLTLKGYFRNVIKPTLINMALSVGEDMMKALPGGKRLHQFLDAFMINPFERKEVSTAKKEYGKARTTMGVPAGVGLLDNMIEVGKQTAESETQRIQQERHDMVEAIKKVNIQNQMTLILDGVELKNFILHTVNEDR